MSSLTNHKAMVADGARGSITINNISYNITVSLSRKVFFCQTPNLSLNGKTAVKYLQYLFFLTIPLSAQNNPYAYLFIWLIDDTLKTFLLKFFVQFILSYVL